jgi:pilus assembly protein CpaC
LGSGGGRLVFLHLVTTVSLGAQEQPQLTETIAIPRGHSTILTHPAELERLLLTDEEIIDVVILTGNEIVLNGLQIGSTTLLIWGVDGSRAAYSVRVVPDARYVQEEFDRLFPGIPVQAVAAGDAIILTGEAPDAQVAARLVGLATSAAGGATVVDYIAVQESAQILLQVRFAEVSRSAVQRLGSTLLYLGEDQVGVGTRGFGGAFPGGPSVTFSDAVNFFLFHEASNVATFIEALRSEGSFRSLAEPNLLAYPGEEASFLAGGEFPYPTISGTAQQVSIQFREFGIRLNFTPNITNSGAIRLRVAPEVSQLDFGSGLQIAGFTIPSLLSRRAETTVELDEGQTFAIAGLMDNTMSRSLSKVPLLGDIPILGALFRSQELRDDQTELLVLVTPYFVLPRDTPPDVPTGEVEDWGLDRFMRPVPPPAGPPAPPIPWQPAGPGGID